ncbi:uncharacterized protein LOC131436107 [Malaya genurostris]|uniref:uncharacterized protein LOC131436107 n=1 Tax=Malaya genurostris TaxID=325434 RepID=UPI0026F3FF77|nr:uncharacterized protein LOC131436107 [Malaya genurostris]
MASIVVLSSVCCFLLLTLLVPVRAADDLSYFFGSRAVTDVLCQQKTLTKGTSTPARVGYTTNSATKLITMVTVNADRESTYGYTVQIESGNVGTNTVNFNVLGKSHLPYNIIFDFYCTP